MQPDDPFFITGPALISFSGGRSSAYMLWRILQAHGGTLPDDVHVTFADTGKEREETLRFVHECATRWGVRVRWLEWRLVDNTPGFDEVGFNSAARFGEPFDALIDWKKYLPNAKQRICTEELKVKTMARFMRAEGYKDGEYIEALGLRADEGIRLLRMAGGNVKHGRKCKAPLATAGVTREDVMRFWAEQDFDLGLEPWEGNCTLCFAKAKGVRKRIIRDRPWEAPWWAAAERRRGATFDKRVSIETLMQQVRASPTFDEFEGGDPEDEHDAECGAWCGA